jgi:hypothetical protein
MLPCSLNSLKAAVPTVRLTCYYTCGTLCVGSQSMFWEIVKVVLRVYWPIPVLFAVLLVVATRNEYIMWRTGRTVRPQETVTRRHNTRDRNEGPLVP